METKHTQGPWNYRKHSQDDEDIARIRKAGLEPTLLLSNDGSAPIMAGDTRVALVDCQTKFKRGMGYKTECAEREANAKLIAAAPELLEQLSHAVRFWDQLQPADIERYKSAIAKATA